MDSAAHCGLRSRRHGQRRRRKSSHWSRVGVVGYPRRPGGSRREHHRPRGRQDNNGRDARFSLRCLAAPPAASCVQLDTDDEVFRKPDIASAAGDLLLIHMVVAVKGVYYMKYPHNFFVYKADPDLPWALPLPPPRDVMVRPELTGIARRGEEFPVAHLMTWDVHDHAAMRRVEVAMVQLYSSATGRWETKRLAMPLDPDKGLDEFEWETDTVISFHGLVCWVDYHHGILYCDVFSPDPELVFLRFPGIEMLPGSRRGIPTRYRTVSICCGRLKFVDVDNGQFWSTDSDDDDVSIGSEDDVCIEIDASGCSVRTWTLKMPEFEWEEEASLLLPELWSLPVFRDSALPRTVPTYPMVSLHEADVLHFVLKGPGLFYEAWMITVDMKTKLLRQHMLYENPIEVDLINVFPECPMICSEIVKWPNISADS
ncbi:hypothetical protein ACP70R_025597 [Stipagrostis hirtigluma subsp. patula]